MNFLILADDDGIRHGIEPTPADVLVSCGDLADLVILEAAKTVRSAHILAVKGNHDSGAPFPQPIVDLHLATVTINHYVKHFPRNADILINGFFYLFGCCGLE
jgi:predicted phosphodiesterase